MQSITNKLSPFTRTSKSVAKLHRLFTSLLELCRPLFDATAEDSDVPSNADDDLNTFNNFDQSISVSNE